VRGTGAGLGTELFLFERGGSFHAFVKSSLVSLSFSPPPPFVFSSLSRCQSGSVLFSFPTAPERTQYSQVLYQAPQFVSVIFHSSIPAAPRCPFLRLPFFFLNSCLRWSFSFVLFPTVFLADDEDKPTHAAKRLSDEGPGKSLPNSPPTSSEYLFRHSISSTLLSSS